MLMPRLIPILFLKNGHLVRSEGFNIHQNIGNPLAQVDRYNTWKVDELIYIDITKEGGYEYQRKDLGGIDRNTTNYINGIIKVVAKKCFMPVTFGGGIRTLDDAHIRFELGADKITLNTQALREPKFITELSREFGSQAIVVSIDAKRLPNGSHSVFSEWGTLDESITPDSWAYEVQERGAGEILINSIDHDGKANGYDLELIKSVVSATEVPVIACGGVGNFDDFKIVLEEVGASAAAAGNIFNFRELAYPLAKKHLKSSGLNVR
jgi:imidazole glycerol-phosphate synthase subunit HisF